ncbi:hypothetical protein F4804DRAFT_354238 [Jackrogersella minutella]|nr:hypothetical protein F4804DRAFT_354238 [Jackrogersella minutella]
MPSSSSRETKSHSSRHTDEEPKRRKRYSLRIEFLDDEDDERERSRETGHRRRRPHKDAASPSPQRTATPAPSRPQPSSQRRRRASTSSTAAVLGTGSRSGLSPTRDGSDSSAAEERLPRDSGRRESLGGAADPLERFQRQMSRKPARRDAAAQTAIRGLDPRAAFFGTRPPSSGRDAEAAYDEGFRLGRRLAASLQRPPSVASSRLPSEIRPPQPLPAQDRRGDQPAAGGEPREQREFLRLFTNLFSRSSPPPQSGSRGASARSQRQRR